MDHNVVNLGTEYHFWFLNLVYQLDVRSGDQVLSDYQVEDLLDLLASCYNKSAQWAMTMSHCALPNNGRTVCQTSIDMVAGSKTAYLSVCFDSRLAFASRRGFILLRFPSLDTIQ